MFVLAQLSDPHLGPLPPVRLSELISKRLFGYLNWRFNRQESFDAAVLAALIADVHANEPDHIAVTGDLANLGLHAELGFGREWLSTIGEPTDVSVVPGNHDVYVPGAYVEMTRAWRDFMLGDEPSATIFPYLRRRGSVAIIGVSTAVATAPLMATGRIGRLQAETLAHYLVQTGKERLYRIVLIHHPPIAGTTHWGRGLTDAILFREAIAVAGAELILHGHNHRTAVGSLAGAAGPVPVVGAAAAAAPTNGHGQAGRYNLIRIEGRHGQWTTTLTERGIDRAEGKVTTISERVLGRPAGQPAGTFTHA